MKYNGGMDDKWKSTIYKNLSFAILTPIFFILFYPSLNSIAATEWFVEIFRTHVGQLREDSENLNEMSM
jgi:hypothetical protein